MGFRTERAARIDPTTGEYQSTCARFRFLATKLLDNDNHVSPIDGPKQPHLDEGIMKPELQAGKVNFSFPLS